MLKIKTYAWRYAGRHITDAEAIAAHEFVMKNIENGHEYDYLLMAYFAR